MSGFLFDTCIVRNWYAKNLDIESRIQSLPGRFPLYISSITLGEIEFAHAHQETPDKTKQAHFRKWMRETFELPELPITADTAIEYAKFRNRLFSRFDRKGKYTENREDKLGQKVGIDENDLWLAAQACERNLTLITHDGMSRIVEIVDEDVIIDEWPNVPNPRSTQS